MGTVTVTNEATPPQNSDDIDVTNGSANVLPKDSDGTRAKGAFTPSTTSVDKTLAATTTRFALDASSTYVRIRGDGTNSFYIMFGDSSVEAVVGDAYIVATDPAEVFCIPTSATHLAFIDDAAGSGGIFNVVEM